MDINYWTQAIRPSEGVMNALEHNDVVLLDDEGKPFAVLVSIDRYSIPLEEQAHG